MLTRRRFAGFASCAICGLTQFVASEVSAQGAPPAATAGVTRKILSQTDGPTPGYVTVLAEALLKRERKSPVIPILESSPAMFWKAASSFPSRGRKHAFSRQAMASRSNLRHRTGAGLLPPPRSEF
jgi:hypothetical protein